MLSRWRVSIPVQCSAVPGEAWRESYWDRTNEVAPRGEVKVLGCRMLLLLLAHVAHVMLVRRIPVAVQYTSLATGWRFEAGAMSAVLGWASDLSCIEFAAEVRWFKVTAKCWDETSTLNNIHSRASERCSYFAGSHKERQPRGLSGRATREESRVAAVPSELRHRHYRGA